MPFLISSRWFRIGCFLAAPALLVSADSSAAPLPPAAPVLLAPASGATGVTVAPTLSWNPATGATSYDLYFGASSLPPFVTNTTATSYAPGNLSSGSTYYWQIVARGSVGTASSAIWSFTTGSAPAGLRFVPVTPCRVVDTRFGGLPFGGPSMGTGETRTFPIPQSGCGIPPTAQAYSFNVTVVPKGPLSYLTLWPAGQTPPLVSTLNSFGGIVVANAAIVPAGANGGVNVFVTNPTDVILDINGYFDTSTGPNSYWFYTATPCRVADTRGPAGQFGGPGMQAGEIRDFPIPLSSCAVPDTAGAYSLNVTVVPDQTAHYLGYLTTWPTGQSQPLVSTLNSWTGKVVANAALVPAGTNESISVFVSNPTDVILDINGYSSGSRSSGALLFHPVTPCRVADTRFGGPPLGGPEMGAGETRSFPIPAGGCNIPSTAAAYSLNVTVVPAGYLGYLSVWPAGQSQPVVSTLNSWDGSVVANAAIVPAGTSGSIDLYVPNPTHVILDINGYFAPAPAFQHVVVIFQENRTPDNLFQGLCSAPFGSASGCGTSPTSSQYNIQTANWIDKSSATGVTQPSTVPLANAYDLSHAHSAFVAQCDKDAITNACRMDGAASVSCSGTCPAKPQFRYVDNSTGTVTPYLQLATRYGWANYMFQTNQGPSYPAHQFIFGATSAPSAADDAAGIFASENTPGGCAAPAGATVQLITPTGENQTTYPCFEHSTVADLLAGPITWRYYAPSAGSIWTAPNSISHICQSTGPGGNCAGTEWSNNVDLVPANVLRDIAACNLRSVSWVIPTGQNSDHANSNDGGGPSWVTSIVNAIGNSTACDGGTGYWQNTAIVITWDDWGGWYDHEPPTILAPPQGDYQYGFRVPLIFVSAYTPAHYINGNRQDFGSILRFVEQNFGIREGTLSFADARAANDLRGFYDLSTAPRPFANIAAPKDAAFFLNDTRRATDPDDDDQ